MIILTTSQPSQPVSSPASPAKHSDLQVPAEPFVLTKFDVASGFGPEGPARRRGSARAPFTISARGFNHPMVSRPHDVSEPLGRSQVEARIQALMDEGDRARTFLVALFSTAFFLGAGYALLWKPVLDRWVF